MKEQAIELSLSSQLDLHCLAVSGPSLRVLHPVSDGTLLLAKLASCHYHGEDG